MKKTFGATTSSKGFSFGVLWKFLPKRQGSWIGFANFRAPPPPPPPTSHQTVKGLQKKI